MVEAVLMDTSQFMVGSISILYFGAIAVYTYRTVKHLEQHQDVSLAMFFLHDESVTAFKTLSASMILVAASILITGITLIYKWNTVRIVSRTGTVIGLVGAVYFYRTIADITQKPA